EEWQESVRGGRLLAPSEKPAALEDVVRAGEEYLRVQPGTIEPPVNPRVKVLYEDEALIVLHKPAPPPNHSCGTFHRNTPPPARATSPSCCNRSLRAVKWKRTTLSGCMGTSIGTLLRWTHQSRRKRQIWVRERSAKTA